MTTCWDALPNAPTGETGARGLLRRRVPSRDGVVVRSPARHMRGLASPHDLGQSDPVRSRDRP